MERSQESVATLLGTDEIPEVTLTSPSAPGVTHKFTSIHALNDEIAGARIYAGFHYRYSTVVGSDLGKKVGAYVAQNAMQPLKVATNNQRGETMNSIRAMILAGVSQLVIDHRLCRSR